MFSYYIYIMNVNLNFFKILITCIERTQRQHDEHELDVVEKVEEQ